MFGRGMLMSRCRTVTYKNSGGMKLLDRPAGQEGMIWQLLNPPQRQYPQPGPESSAVTDGERGMPS
jgi:hypothetical protein